MRTLDVEAKAGAIAVSTTEIAVGTLVGYVRYSYPTLTRLTAVEGLFSEGCSGLQFVGEGLLLLGFDVGQSFAKPADWKHSLVSVDDAGVRDRVDLGPGNWMLVKGLSGRMAVLYDVSEGQGILGVDAVRGARWSQPGKVRRVVAHGNTQVLAMNDSAVLVLSRESGDVDAEHRLPDVDGTSWTAVAARGNEFFLGGHTPTRAAYVLARWRPGSAPVVARIPLGEIFSPDLVERAMCDEETCGADLFHVASIRADQQDRLVLALGGDGERLGACQGACAIAVVDPSSLERLSVRLVDDSDGASGMLLATDGGIIVNCCGSIHVVPPHKQARS